MRVEVTLKVYFPEGEWPDEGELEAAIQERYPDATVVGYDEEEV